MAKYRISVIMGIYNCASTLVEALDSLYAQTYQDFKVILCDDGSTDDTYQVAKNYAAGHDNIILIRNDRNMGLNFTLNHCLEFADTEYVARMDGDDISLPTRFEKEINFLDAHPEYAIVSCPMIYFDESGEFARGKVTFHEPQKEHFVYGPPFCHAPCMVRREAYETVGGYTVDKRLLRMEDYNLWMKMYAKGFKGYNINECLYAMRDDRNAVRRRDLKAAFHGIYAHYLAHREFSLPYSKLVSYSLKKIGKRLLPDSIYTKYHKQRLSGK